MTGMELLEAKTGKMEENKQRFIQKKTETGRDERKGSCVEVKWSGVPEKNV